jgi:hypothetical protein
MLSQSCQPDAETGRLTVVVSKLHLIALRSIFYLDQTAFERISDTAIGQSNRSTDLQFYRASTAVREFCMLTKSRKNNINNVLRTGGIQRRHCEQL